ncbi:hypothetical protein C1645_747318 [Glomus cerebriforme]|uniref:Uncharacterized protein n=1 Tax=Glomus cerebriforme TaxID=658196 RepID=A0A397TS52_9GLOM|nr:hypothetical protein C1645_747318 [Glomus cerebriforme]
MKLILLFVLVILTFNNFAAIAESLKRDELRMSPVERSPLVKRATGGCDPGYYACTDSEGGCCPNGSSCLPNFHCSSSGSSSSSSGGSIGSPLTYAQVFSILLVYLYLVRY